MVTYAESIIHLILNYLFSGDSILIWPIFKIIMALLGSFSLFMIIFKFNEAPKSPLLKTKFHIISFIIISALGGLTILRPEDAIAAFPAGLIGWFLVLKQIEGNKQQNNTNNTSSTKFTESALTQKNIKERYKNELK
ncbi:MAG: hypothetical protein K8S23_00680 [Candidatus Cloacimonetes bacterium]|nr:hypothetical protein [Candidatus Cloacimonadota bacterium]